MRNSMKAMFALFVSLFLVASCGQKAPLFLPGDPGSLTTDVPGKAPDDATADEDDKDDDDDEN